MQSMRFVLASGKVLVIQLEDGGAADGVVPMAAIDPVPRESGSNSLLQPISPIPGQPPRTAIDAFQQLEQYARAVAQRVKDAIVHLETDGDELVCIADLLSISNVPVRKT